MRRRRASLILVLGLVVAVAGFWLYRHNVGSLQLSAQQELAFAEIRNNRGRPRIEEMSDGRQGIVVSFYGPRVTDVELASVQGLTQVHSLYIQETKVTDAGLAHLEDQSQLR